MVKLKAICLLGLGCVTLAAALIVVLSNMGNEWEVHLFFKSVSLRRGTMLTYAGVLGAVLWATWRWSIPAGIRAAKAWRKSGAAKATADAAKATADRLAKLESGGGSEPPST